MPLFTTDKDTTKSVYSYAKSRQNQSTACMLLGLPTSFKIKSQTVNNSLVRTQICLTSSRGICPSCFQSFSSIHSSYNRTLEDLPICGKPHILSVLVRKFYCKNRHCAQKIFSQDISAIAAPYGRRTTRSENQIIQTSLEVSSCKSSYLLKLQHIQASSSTCLRRLHALPLPVAESVRHIAIDDFAFKKGHTYGSIIVNQITGTPIEMLNSRDYETVGGYLRSNPQLLTITRDRGHCFSRPISEIMPNVTQVCDRFHLIKNLSDNVIEDIKKQLKKAEQHIEKETFEYPLPKEAYHSLHKELFGLGTERQTSKPQLYLQVHELKKQRLTVLQISQQLGVKPRQVYKYSRMERIDSLLTIEQNTLLRHLNSIADLVSRGIIETKELSLKLNATVKQEWIARLTLNMRKEWQSKKQELRELAALGKRKRKIHSKEIFKVFFKEGYQTTCEVLKWLLIHHPKIRGMITMCLQFRAMMNRNNQAIELRKWIENAQNCGMQVLEKFAKGISAEQQAVQEAMDCPWNNGLAEGTVNRIKNIKRQMYGRAGFELLKRKIILAKWG